jgi:hypothetical protein
MSSKFSGTDSGHSEASLKKSPTDHINTNHVVHTNNTARSKEEEKEKKNAEVETPIRS